LHNCGINVSNFEKVLQKGNIKIRIMLRLRHTRPSGDSESPIQKPHGADRSLSSLKPGLFKDDPPISPASSLKTGLFKDDLP
jgi:hypothetical protein